MKQGDGFEFRDLMEIERLSSPAVSPDGEKIVYVLTSHNSEKNTKRSSLYMVKEGSDPMELTPGEGSHSDPAWSPDGKRLAFVSDRGGDSQIWILPVEEGGEAGKITERDEGCSKPVWSPDGKIILFTGSGIVSPHWDGNSPVEGDDEEKKRRIHALSYGLVNERSSARIEDSLLYRHWDHWREMKRSHLFAVEVDSGKTADLTPGDADVPPISLGGVLDYGFSPEGDEVVYVKNPDSVVAESTNNSLFLQGIKGIETVGEPVKISENDAMDLEPRYSPDGRYIAYLGAEIPGYEADRLKIKLNDRKKKTIEAITEGLDRSPSPIEWSPDSKYIYFNTPHVGYMPVFRISVGNRRLEVVTSGSYNSAFRPLEGGSLLVARESATSPSDLFIVRSEGSEGIDTSPGPDRTRYPREESKRLTDYGSWLVGKTGINDPEEFWYGGADGDPVHGFIIKPPGFEEGKRYPLVMIIHGGPQSAFFNHFHYRWNPQLFASRGYVVAEINPRGSVGYGQEFTDQISGDWGGRCYEDLMKGLDHLLESYGFVDPDHVGAAGASFGGFMVNWMQGHTDRFNVLVSHDGIFNQETMSYMTEELWFDTWEHDGYPHENRESFRKFSPHMFVENFKTPMLVIQGEQDFRCPVSEGVSLFTALQVMNVPSRFLYLPDEGHWVLKPANLEVWYDTVLEFIGDHI